MQGQTDQVLSSVKATASQIDVVRVNGEPMSQLPDDLYIPPQALEVFLESFHGPLDLLLYLIRKQNIDILNIPIVEITDQYVSYVNLMRTIRLDLAGDYLVMASTLAHIKSRLLLPKPELDEDDEDDDPRMALVKQLQEYELFNQAAQELDQRPRMQREFHSCHVDTHRTEPAEPLQAQATLDDLSKAFKAVLERVESLQNWHISHEKLTVQERMVAILEQLQTDSFLAFNQICKAEEGRLGVVVSFLALLELMRDQLVQTVQDADYATIYLQVKDGH